MFTRIAARACALLLATTSLAAADFYVGAGLGEENDAGSFRQGLERFAEADGEVWKLFAGVELGRYLALEVATHDFGTQRCCRGVADLGFVSEVDGYSGTGLGRWPLGRFEPFVKVGVVAWEEDGEFITLLGVSPRAADGTDLVLGAGVAVDLPARLRLRAEWERFEFDEASSDGVTASLMFRFGAPAS